MDDFRRKQEERRSGSLSSQLMAGVSEGEQSGCDQDVSPYLFGEDRNRDEGR